jgi:WD40 repeat protein
MGRVLECEDPVLGRKVALKVSTLGVEGDWRFEREARVLALLDHPSIVPVHALGRDADGRPYYSMKLVRGRTLQEVIRGLRAGDDSVCRQFNQGRLLGVFLKVCEGVAYAHSRGVLHRDLKPDNVMVGEFGEVFVMDWGIAKWRGEDPALPGCSGDGGDGGSGAGHTLAGSLIGSPQYMAPEQAQGRLSDMDERSDVYSLGAMLYSLLSLRPPVGEGSVQEVLSKVSEGTWVSESLNWEERLKRTDSGVRQVPEGLRAVLKKALSTRKESRYPGVVELMGEIEAYLRGYATEAENAGFLRQLLLLVRRNRAVSALTGVLLGAGIFFGWSLLQSEARALQKAELARLRSIEAEASAKKARESARRAELALASNADEQSAAETLREALDRVPAADREADWEYLNRRLESQDRVVETLLPGKDVWISVLPDPAVPGRLLGLQSDGKILGVDCESGKREVVWDAGRSPGIKRFAVSGDGKVLCTARENAGVQVNFFRREKGEKIKGIELPVLHYLNVRLSRDGSLLLLEGMNQLPKEGGEIGTHLEVWDWASEKLCLKIEEPGWVWGEFSPDGNQVRVVASKAPYREMEARTGRVLKTGVRTPVFDPTRRLFSLSSSGGKLASWHWGQGQLEVADTQTGSKVFGHRVPNALRIEFMESGVSGLKLVSLVMRDAGLSCLQYWNVESGVRLREVFVPGSKGQIPGLCVDPRTGHTAVYSRGNLMIWNFREEPPLASIQWSGRSIGWMGKAGRIAFNSTGRDTDPLAYRDLGNAGKSRILLGSQQKGPLNEIFGASNGGVLIGVGAQNAAFQIRGDEIRVQDAPWLAGCTPRCLNPEGKWFLKGRSVSEVFTGNLVFEIPADQRSMAFRGETEKLWVGNERFAEWGALEQGSEKVESSGWGIRLWDAKNGRLEASGRTPSITCLSGSPDGRWIACSSGDRRIRLLDGRTLEPARDFIAHDGRILYLAWDWESSRLISSSEDMTVRAWDPGTGRPLGEIRLGSREPTILCPGPEGRLLVRQRGAPMWEVFGPSSWGDRN